MRLKADFERAKERVEKLRLAHGYKKKDVIEGFGFSRQYYHKKYLDSPKISAKSLENIKRFFGVTEYDLLHASEHEFDSLPIMKAYYEYKQAKQKYESLKGGAWNYDFTI